MGGVGEGWKGRGGRGGVEEAEDVGRVEEGIC